MIAELADCLAASLSARAPRAVYDVPFRYCHHTRDTVDQIVDTLHFWSITYIRCFIVNSDLSCYRQNQCGQRRRLQEGHETNRK